MKPCNIFFLSVALFVSINLSAQTNDIGTIRGTVVNESTNQPLEFVSVLLYRDSDSTIVTGTSTENNGKLELINIPTGEYYIRFSLIGYKERVTPVFVIDARHKRLNLGTISLVETTVNMNEVEVTAEKPLFNYSIGKKVYNVDQDIMSQSFSASEVLQNIPSVKVEIDGKVSLRGSSNVLIMVNGKTSPLMDRGSADLLDQMPASSIDKIEVITNPSARYKADGKSGIINIVLKKDKTLGINGHLTTHAGSYGRYNGNMRVNYNPGIYNIYGSMSLRKDYRNHKDIDARLWEIPNGPSVSVFSYDDSIFSLARPISSIFTLGMDYHIDEQNSSGISGNYFHRGYSGVDTSKKVYQDANRITLREFDTDRSGYQFEDEYGVTGYFRHSFSKEDHKLRLEFAASRSPKQEDNNFTTVYLLPQNPSRYDHSIVKENNNRRQLSLDYSDPVTEKSLLEAGYAGEFNNEDMSLYSEFYNTGQQQFVKDTVKTYDFHFDQSIHAVYLTYKQTLGRFEFLGGLRTEYARRKSDLVTLDSTISNNFFNAYPSFHLAYKFSNSAEMQFSYSRRINRPKAKDLNPFREYRDARTVYAGNPDLLPEYIHSLELGCQFQSDHVSVLPTIYYRYTYNRITSIRQVLSGFTLLTTKKNLAHDQSLGAEMIVSVTAGHFFSAHFNANAIYDEIDAPDIDYIQNNIIRSINSALTCNLTFARGSRLQISTHYNSSRLTAQGIYLPNYVVNMGMRQELFDGKLTLLLTVSDIFKTWKRELDLDAPPLHQAVINVRDSRVVYFGFTFYLGKVTKKTKEEQWHYEDDDQ